VTLDPSRVSAFYAFMRERELIRLRRLHGLSRDEWTKDEILKKFSFTNVKREHDRTTQQFRRIYQQLCIDIHGRDDVHPDHPDSGFGMDWQNCQDLLTTCAVFRFFGTVKSAEVIGPYTWAGMDDSSSGPGYFQRIRDYGDQGDLTFTSAYIVTSAGRSDPKHHVVAEALEQFSEMTNEVLEALQAENGPRSWQKAVEVMTRCYCVGSFMAKEIILDYLMMMPDVCRDLTDWSTWTPVGPGGKRGAARIRYGGLVDMSESEALDVIREVYAARSEHWPRTFSLPWSHMSPNCDNHCGCDEGSRVTAVELDLTDIQFQMCEFDKYSRVAEGRRPKRLFKPTIDTLTRKDD